MKTKEERNEYQKLYMRSRKIFENINTFDLTKQEIEKLIILAINEEIFCFGNELREIRRN